MKSVTFLSLVFLLSSVGWSQSVSAVYINSEKVSAEMLAALEYTYGINIQNGRYWYDRISGLWGLEGGPTLGIVLPGLSVGGRLEPGAANGNTGVFINGLELHWQDVRNLRQWLGEVRQGSYWLDAYGNVGYIGGPAFMNLWQLASRQQNTFYRNSYTGIGTGSSGGTSYVIGKDFSVIVDH